MLFGLPWPDDQEQQAEAALAIAPPIIPRSILRGDSLDIVTVADAYVKAIPAEINVVFFSDLTLWLDHHGSTCSSRGTDWEAGKEQLLNSDVAALYLTLSHLAHPSCATPAKTVPPCTTATAPNTSPLHTARTSVS
jgi:hypothetical protein